jgi:anti-anti-sigma factor
VRLNEFEAKYLAVEERGETVVVEVEVAYLNEDMNLEQFGHELFALVEQCGCRRLVVCMRQVQMISSGGLGKMITLHRKMHRHQGMVVFCDLQPAVEDVLNTSRLITYLNVTGNVEEGLAQVAS